MLHIKPIVSTLLRSKSGPLLLLIQIILSVTIVANASFIISERLTLMARESGIAEAEVFDFSIYNFDKSVEIGSQNQRDVDTVRALPGVIDATSTSMTPLSGGGWMTSFVMGESEATAKDTEGAAAYYGDEHMISTLGLNLTEGRNFYQDEVYAGSPDLANRGIVSADFAKATWGGESALGKIIYMGAFGQQPVEIIGVVEHLQGAWVDSSNLNNSIILNVELQFPFTKFLVRAEPHALAGLKETIPLALHKDQRNRVIRGFKLISEHRTEVYRNHELMATVLSIMVVLLLLITSLGLAGMVMFNIERRTKQIGTRRALGASKRDIVSYFLVENYLICLVGGVLGVLLAFQLGQQLMKLYDLPLLNPLFPVLTFVGLFVVTTLAVIVPARIAANISPSIATRSV